jgi:hypothetical protein
VVVAELLVPEPLVPLPEEPLLPDEVVPDPDVVVEPVAVLVELLLPVSGAAVAVPPVLVR